MPDYADCIYCGGEVSEQRQPREIRWEGQLHIVEGDPMGVCGQCGERFLKPHVAEAVDALLDKGEPAAKVEVPVLTFATGAA